MLLPDMYVLRPVGCREYISGKALMPMLELLHMYIYTTPVVEIKSTALWYITDIHALWLCLPYMV